MLLRMRHAAPIAALVVALLLLRHHLTPQQDPCSFRKEQSLRKRLAYVENARVLAESRPCCLLLTVAQRRAKMVKVLAILATALAVIGALTWAISGPHLVDAGVQTTAVATATTTATTESNDTGRTSHADDDDKPWGDCRICWSPMRPRSDDAANHPTVLVPCGHVFCQGCLRTLGPVTTPCPMCRSRPRGHHRVRP